MAELSEVPIKELLHEALRRQDEMLDENGLLGPESFAVADFLGTRVCVDGVAVRQNQNSELELMAIRRNSGPYIGRLCLVGGGVGRVIENDIWVPESFEEALRRHFRTDLGFEIEPVSSWQEPQYLAQDMRPIEDKVREGFMPNPASRHLVAARFLVKITDDGGGPVFGSTEVGGQEASGIKWFSEAAMPDPSEFGYNHGQTYEAMFPIANRLFGLAGSE